MGAGFSEKIPILRIALFALLALPCVVPASAETLTGGARIIDADTVEIAGEKLRLERIDAPESRQTCKRDGADARPATERPALFLQQFAHQLQGCFGVPLRLHEEIQDLASIVDRAP